MLIVNFLFLSLGYVQQSDTLKIEINKSVSDWYYIVPSSKVEASNRVATNTDGVCYLSERDYVALKNLSFYIEGVDVTNSVRFLSRVSYDMFDEGVHKKYSLMRFYLQVMPNSECCPAPKYGDIDGYTKKSNEEKRYRDKLIREGKIKFQ